MNCFSHYLLEFSAFTLYHVTVSRSWFATVFSCFHQCKFLTQKKSSRIFSRRDTISLTTEAAKTFGSNLQISEDFSENEIIAICVRNSLFLSSLVGSFIIQFSSVVFIIKQWYKMHPTSNKGKKEIIL